MECVGCADRSCFDLSRHSSATKVDLTAKETLAEPVSFLTQPSFRYIPYGQNYLLAVSCSS